MLTGIVRPDVGTVILEQRDVTNAGIDVRARLGLGYVPQSADLFSELSTEENLKIAVEGKRSDPQKGKRFIALVIKIFGLESIRGQRVGELSGGQRKLVEIAFSVCAQPRILLLDEPFAGLDPLVLAVIADRLRMLSRVGIGIILTDHNVREALQVVDRAIVIHDGVLLKSGTARDIAADPEVRRRFLGEQFSLHGTPAG